MPGRARTNPVSRLLITNGVFANARVWQRFRIRHCRSACARIATDPHYECARIVVCDRLTFSTHITTSLSNCRFDDRNVWSMFQTIMPRVLSLGLTLAIAACAVVPDIRYFDDSDAKAPPSDKDGGKDSATGDA